MKRVLSNPLALTGFVLISLMLVLALLSPWLAPYDPDAIQVKDILLPPSSPHWMCTAGLAREVWSRRLFGALIS